MKLFRKREEVLPLLVLPGIETPIFDVLSIQMPLPDWSDYLGDLEVVAA